MKRFVIILLCLVPLAAFAVDSTACIKIGNEILFCINQPEGSLKSQQRAQIATNAIEDIMTGGGSLDSIKIVECDSQFVIVYKKSASDSMQVISVLPADTFGTGKTIEELSQDWYWKIRRGIAGERERSLSAGTIAKLALGVLFPVFLILAYILIHRIYTSLAKSTVKCEGTAFRGITIKGAEFIPSRLQVNIVLKLLFALKWIVVVIVFYVMILGFFTLFPPTKTYTDVILATSLNWLGVVGNVLIDVAKFLIAGAALYIIARILWGLVDIIFRHYEVSSETTKIPLLALASLKRFFKLVIAFFFAVGLVAVVPGHGEYVALAMLLLATIFLGIAVLPFITSIFAGLAFALFRGIKFDDTITVGKATGKLKAIGLVWSSLSDEQGEEILFMNTALLRPIFYKPYSMEEPPLDTETE